MGKNEKEKKKGVRLTATNVDKVCINKKANKKNGVK